jgi:hypothetical protein
MSSACSIDSDLEPEQTEHIRFGSFSLEDVINSEIKKFGRFALRGRNSSGQAASKFIEEFSKPVSPQKVPDGNYRAGTPSRKTENTRGVLANNPAKAQTDPVKPSYPFGTCVEDLFSHSWSDRVGSWFWFPKGLVLVAAEEGLGFPATKSEIRRFGSNCRRVVCVKPKRVDDRSFAEVAVMDRGRDLGRAGSSNSRLGDRGGPGRFGGPGSGYTQGEDGFTSGDRFFDRGRIPTDGGREGFRGFGGGPRVEAYRPNTNKRQFDDRERMEKEEMDLRAKLRREREDRRANEEYQRKSNVEVAEFRGRGKGMQNSNEYHCFNCDKTGHLRKDFPNPPFCYCCKKSGHRSVVCPKKRGLRLCGYGIPGQGFYSIHIPNDKKDSGRREVLGIMIIEDGQASVEIIEKELRHLFREVPKWTIKKMSADNEYMISFPNEDIR